MKSYILLGCYAASSGFLVSLPGRKILLFRIGYQQCLFKRFLITPLLQKGKQAEHLGGSQKAPRERPTRLTSA